MSKGRQLPPIPEFSSSRRRRFSTSTIRWVSMLGVVGVCVLAASSLPTLLGYFSAPPPAPVAAPEHPVPQQAEKETPARVDLSQRVEPHEKGQIEVIRDGQRIRRVPAPDALRTSAVHGEQVFPGLGKGRTRPE